MTEFTVVSTREEAFKVWDRRGVIIREDDGYYFVYPRLGRGIKYPGFDLKRDCCLNTFISREKAEQWALDMGYLSSFIRS